MRLSGYQTMKLIIHITTRSAWQSAQQAGEYTAPSLATEGFIHCSTAGQVVAVAERFYAGQHGLVLLILDSKRIRSEVRYEPGADKPDELFPHVYGPINLDAVTRVVEDFAPDPSGKWILPAL
jgi:uncharacterized protein (DUF952 family)